MNDHLLKNLKAYVALTGTICTALLATYTGGTVGTVLTVVSTVATAFGTWYAENAPSETDI